MPDPFGRPGLLHNLLCVLCLIGAWMLPHVGAAQSGITCPYVLQGIPTNVYTSTKTVSAAVTCTAAGASVSIGWGDATGFVNASSPTTQTHTYTPATVNTSPLSNGVIGTTDPFEVSVNQIPQYVAFPSVAAVNYASFAGQSSSVNANVAVPADMTFDCTTVVSSTGVVSLASDLNISCASVPAMTRLTNGPKQPVVVVVGTSGIASTFALLRAKSRTRYVVLFPLPACLLLGFAYRARRRALRRIMGGSSLVVASLTIVSCGGGFGLPKLTPTATPPGLYQVTVVSKPVTASTTFEQTSLIVPLVVSPPQ